MFKENLFELIRKEEVIIWAGAGMSLYAGYPSGKRLAEILVEKLTSKEKELIDTNIPLPELAEEFYKLKGNNKNSLIQILNETFGKKADSTDTHDILSIIPHFRTIITTNYDSLFENAYGEKAQLIFKTTQIPYINNKKIQIFKVHGCLNEPESVILTKSDYNNFFKENKDNGTFWSVIRERLATKTVLFLGYNLEDPNVLVIFDRIMDSLGENRKESFLVAPKLPQYRVNNLIKKGIHYIDSTAEDIISDLLIHLKENIISDIESGKTSADTFRNFLANIDLLPDLKADKDSYKVTSLKGAKENIYGRLNFTFKNDGDLIKDFEDLVQGKRFGTLKIPEDKLLNADFWYGGVRFPDSDEILKLEFRSNPTVKSKIDIRFEDGFEFNDVLIEIYGSSTLIEIHLQLDSAEIIVRVNLDRKPEMKVDFNYKLKKICKSVKSEIELFSFLKRISEGNEFTIYLEKGRTISKAFHKSVELLEQADFFLNYFTNLKKIEKAYGIRFSNISIDDIDDFTFKNVEYIIAIIENEFLTLDWDEELKMTLVDDYSDETLLQLKNLNLKNASVFLQHNIEEIIKLHDVDICLGYKRIEFQNTFIVNFDDILERKDNVAIVRSSIKKKKVTYEKNIIEE